MLRIYQVALDEDKGHVRELFWEYLELANAQVNEEFGVSLDIESMLERDMVELDKFSPPYARLLLAECGNQVAGLATMRKIREATAEIKRMYVRPAYRRKGIGRALVDCLIKEAR